MVSENPGKGKRSKAAAAAENTEATTEAEAGSVTTEATDTDTVQQTKYLGQIRVAAFTAVALSILGVALSLTTPLWSPKLYGNSTSARIFVLGVAQLRPVLETDGPFSVELATLRKIASDDPAVTKALETIAGYSETGVPTVSQLQSRFIRTSSEIMLGEIVNPSKDWFARMMFSLASALDMKDMAHKYGMKVKNQGSVSDILMQAHAALRTDDLAGAVAALGKLSGRSAELAKPWVAAAQARLAANRVLKLLDQAAANRLSQRPFKFVSAN